MKIDISVPDDVFSSAEDLAAKLGVTTSELYSTAVSEYLAKHQRGKLTAALDRVYSDEDSGLALELQRAQGASIRRSNW